MESGGCVIAKDIPSCDTVGTGCNGCHALTPLHCRANRCMAPSTSVAILDVTGTATVMSGATGPS